MTGLSNGQHQHIINQVQAYIKSHAKLSEKELALLLALVPRYFLSSAVEDLKERPIPELGAIILSHWKFIYERGLNEAKICVFNPDQEQDGWQAKHTIIQISQFGVADHVSLSSRQNGR